MSHILILISNFKIMKRLLYLFVMLIAFSACEDDYEYTFDKTPTERKAEAKSELTSLLEAPEFGWKTTMIVHGAVSSAGDFFVMKFEPNGENNNGEVTVANGFKTHKSEFEIGHEDGILLRFNTFNEVFHWLTKPNHWETAGFGGDLEFIFMREEAGKLIFQGKESQNELILEKATEQDWDMTDIIENHENFMQALSMNFVAITITKGFGATEEKPFYAKFNLADVHITSTAVPEKKGWFYEFEYIVDGEKVYGSEASYVFTHDEIIFSEPVVVEGDTFDRIAYNKDNGLWEVANEGVEGFLEASALPLMPSPGAVDNLLDVFLQGTYGWDISPWNFGDEGKMEDFARGIMDDCEMFDWFVVHGNFTDKDGVHRGQGFVIEGSTYGEYVFLPFEIEKLGESEMKFVWDGTIITNIADVAAAEEVVNTDINIQGMLNAFCNPVGWSIYCSSYFYAPTWEIYPYEFYNMEDTSIVLKRVWSKYY